MSDFASLELNRGYTLFREGESVLHLFWDTESDGTRYYEVSCAYLPPESDGILDGKIFQQIDEKVSFNQGVKHLVRVKRMLKDVVNHLRHSNQEFKMGITPTDERRESAYRSLLKSGWVNRYGTYWLEDAEKFIGDRRV